MEGNFYVSGTLKRPLKSQLGAAFVKCRDEADVYGKCVEQSHVNKVLEDGVCKKERALLRECAEAATRKNRADARSKR